MIVIYTKKVTNRIKYVFDFVFQQYFNLDYHITTNEIEFLASKDFKINYNNTIFQNTFNIPQENILIEDNIVPQKVFISKEGEMPILFPTDENTTIKFDIFSAIFYLITRYEEYLSNESDEHGRYISSNSILSKPVFNFRPIVEIWLVYFKEQILAQEPNLTFKKHTFSKTYTFDIDHAFQYKGRNWLKHPPNILKKEVRNVLFQKHKDAFDTFDEITAFIEQTKNPVFFFFLLNDDGEKNSNVCPKNKMLHAIIQRFKNSITIGIHPSYFFSEENFVAEKKQLEYILDKKIETNRQHFLKIKIPDYFQVLNKQEIKKDFSLGYPNISACRAGTTQAFYFFDLTKNEQTTLLIQPFSFMDATYQYYQKIDDNSITQIVEKQLEDIQKINGNFVSLFHNDLLQNQYVYKKLLYLIEEY